MDQVSNNIIKGPWVGNDPTPNIFTPAEIVNSADGVKIFKATHIQETLLAIMPMLFNNLEIAGFNFSEKQTDDTLKDGTLIVEAVKSLLFKYYEMHHPLQDVAEQIFVVNDEGHLDFAERLDLDLDPIEAIAVELEDDEALEE